MRIDPIQNKNQSQLITDYRNGKKQIMDYFDYQPFRQETFQDRVHDLQERTFKRKELVTVLKSANDHWGAPTSTYDNIDRLQQPESVVVIGGQQAGLLTGPLYTIHKLISIIKLAKEQERKLQIPVVPIFWIAGEDHDFDEINHIYLPNQSTMKKFKLNKKIDDKVSVSHVDKDSAQLTKWIDTLFEELAETDKTNRLYERIKCCADQATTYVDFFARIIFEMFPDDGVVLIDSANSQLRNLEREYFVSIIKKQKVIGRGVYESEQSLQRLGYSLTLGTKENDVNLFYHDVNDRILLERDDEGNFVGKQNEVIMTEEELIKIAKEHPEQLSNNVVTRPVMQELLFPSLAFIGGPGEVSYWSALKPVFQAMNIKMPPVLPRLSYTIVERHIAKLLKKYALTSDRVINGGAFADKTRWIATKANPPVQQVAKEVKQSIDELHQPLRAIAENVQSDLGNLADKNLQHIFTDIDYLTSRIQKVVEDRYEKEISEFDLINISLHPFNGLQERAWNPLPFINKNGLFFIKALINEPCSFMGEHYVVYL